MPTPVSGSVIHSFIFVDSYIKDILCVEVKPTLGIKVNNCREKTTQGQVRSKSCRFSTSLMASCLGFYPMFSSLRSDISIPSF